ncbi:AIM24 family protein [Salisaeta longa]|uniref:AIM24 family protein n=1 Tax=Salisaeta longa TaxID=503170 RepID=UPI0003B4D9CE|nr:AIM24 family protein [Salisaeta longa]
MKLQEFIDQNQDTEGGPAFQLENSKLLDITVNGEVWIKTGAMVAYTGNVSFEKKTSGGITGWLKQAATGEGANTMVASGQGHVYAADGGKNIHVLELGAGESISINGNDVLAYASSVEADIKMMKKIASRASGGLFNVHLTGPGFIAFTTHGSPVVLDTPVRTDPDATVAWSSNTPPSFTTDIGWKSMIGRSSGEEYQMDFNQSGGFVVVQPYEEIGPQA